LGGGLSTQRWSTQPSTASAAGSPCQQRGDRLIKPLAEVSDEEFDNSVGVNVKGCFNGCQLALERMADGGRIVKHLQFDDRPDASRLRRLRRHQRRD
jgi:hypothetical protein